MFLIFTYVSWTFTQHCLCHNRLMNINMWRQLYLQMCLSFSQLLLVFIYFLFLLLFFLSFSLSRNATTINLESSVNAAKTIRPSALTWTLATPSMPISERVYNIWVTPPLTLTHFSHMLALWLSVLSLHLEHTLISASVPVRCLAFVVRTLSVNYKKVRPLSVLCHFDLCRDAIRYGCKREDSCHYAHSVIELKTWRVQRDTGAHLSDPTAYLNRIRCKHIWFTFKFILNQYF